MGWGQEGCCCLVTCDTVGGGVQSLCPQGLGPRQLGCPARSSDTHFFLKVQVCRRDFNWGVGRERNRAGEGGGKINNRDVCKNHIETLFYKLAYNIYNTNKCMLYVYIV